MDHIKDVSISKELHDYNIKNYIGKGAFGKVYYAIDKKTNLEVAIKVHFIFFSNKNKKLFKT